MASTFAMKCPKCGGIVRQSGSPSMINLYCDNFCGKCGLNVKEFGSYARMIRTVGTGDYYDD